MTSVNRDLPRRIPIGRSTGLSALLLACLSFAVSGCGTSLGPTFTETAVPAGGARITFYRPAAFSASATDAILGVEQCGRPGAVVTLANGSFRRYEAGPGKALVIGGIFAMTDRGMIELASGEEVFYEVTLGGFPLKLIKSRVSREQALPALRKLREAPAKEATSGDETC